jgi:hypothetical protein
LVRPALPEAPPTLDTGNGTLELLSSSCDILRPMPSAPPPGPKVTMISIGREGNFSWA